MIGTATAFHRFGLGPRPGDLSGVGEFRDAARAELAITDISRISMSLPGTGQALADLAAERLAQRLAQAAPQGTPAPAMDAAPMAPAMEAAPMAPAMDAAPAAPVRAPAPVQTRLYQGELAARLVQFAAVEIGFVERLVAFWTNHFAIEADSSLVARTLVGAFEREAVRPHVLGSFRDMLGAATKHAAMLAYLNNAQSIGPNSPTGLQREVGLNENHARELMELHTIGVDAGYTQADVTAMARILTGWTYAANADQRVPIGEFLYRPAAHEPGAHVVMGVTYPARGVEQGEAVLDMLAEHPATARHIALKLARHFVADEPPSGLVDGLAATFQTTGGDLRAVALALIDSDEAFADAAKLKSPQEFLWSAMRALGVADLTPQLVLQWLRSLGQGMWDPPSPEGFSDDSATWLAPDAMTTRLDLAELLAARAPMSHNPNDLVDLVLGPAASAETRQTIRSAASQTQALALLVMTPEFQRR